MHTQGLLFKRCNTTTSAIQSSTYWKDFSNLQGIIQNPGFRTPFGDFGLDLASTYGPGPYGPGPLGPYGPGPLIILKNILSQICSRTIFEMHAAPGACLLYAPGAVCFSNMVLAHI